MNTGKKKWVSDGFYSSCQKMKKKIMTLLNFQVLQTEAILGLEINSLSWYRGCFDILFVSRRSGWSGGRTWKLNKIFQNYRILKSMSPNFDSLYLWENSSPPLCVIHIQKRLDLLFHPVFPKFALCCKNHTQIEL